MTRNWNEAAARRIKIRKFRYIRRAVSSSQWLRLKTGGESVIEREYVLLTDNNCDLPKEFLEENNIPAIPLSFHIDGRDYTEYEMTCADFYEQMRQGKQPSTSQCTAAQAVAFMEPFVRQGKDILHVSFASGLSAAFDSCALAARQLEEAYPGSRVYVIDSQCGSMGEGLFLYKLLQMKKAGKTMDELIEWGEANKLKVAHLIMVEDLMHLHRGGRVSKTSAVMGSMLGIKPIVHLNDEGKLVPISKARGRKRGLQALVDMMGELVGDTENDIAFISHSDCREDAEYLADLVRKRFGVENFMINYIGPVIAAHTGMGTVVLFMMVEHR